MARELPTSPKNEQKLHDLVMLPEYVLSFKNFVLRFFPWGQKGTPLAYFSGPRNWQIEEMEVVDAHLFTKVLFQEILLPDQREECHRLFWRMFLTFQNLIISGEWVTLTPTRKFANEQNTNHN